MRNLFYFRMILVAAIAILPAPVSAADDLCDAWVARIVSLQGSVQIQRAGSTDWAPAGLEGCLGAGDLLRVMERSRAGLVLPNDAVLRLDQQTTVTLKPPDEKAGYLLELIQGAIHFFSRVPRTLRLLTPFINGTVEGTEVFLASSRDRGRVAIIEGRLRIQNEFGALALNSGEAAIMETGQAPRLVPRVTARDEIQWAIYYPPVLGMQEAAFETLPDAALGERLKRAAGLFRAGQLTRAFEVIAIPDGAIDEPRFFSFRAGLLLFVGRIDEAALDIERVHRLASRSAEIPALEAVIAVAQGRKEEGLRLARTAIERDRASVPAHIALSIAQQAGFDLAGARKTLEAAAALDPGDGLVCARLAEILLSLGERDAASAAADRAVQLLPDLSRVQMVRGFSLLNRIRLDDALAAFQKAVAQDSADPLPRMGLGLAQIRSGDLIAGRRQIEIAAALDPTNALIRSYLGKAYYEEKRSKLAGEQLDMAKELDRQDPTPWFYDAIRKQAENRPVEALHDLQQSIDRNDNRAVYRSRLMLDDDLAARSASLGRIYRDLGFEQLAVAEGWKSIAGAPEDYSAHRFLSDAYAALPRHEIARVSELLQSQLLQPLNVTPLQPLLAESDLRIFEGLGPSDLSFNEFNPLFLRNRLTLQASAIAGSQGTIGEEIVHAGLWNRIAYSIGQFHYESDGFRTNGDQRQDLVNAFFQVAAGDATHLQTEIRSRRIEHGDLELLFDPQAYQPNQEEDKDVDTLRLGMHHGFAPGSDLIVSYIAQRTDYGLQDHFQFPGAPEGSETSVDIQQDIEGDALELQHLFSNGPLHLVSGAGSTWGQLEQTTTIRDGLVDFGSSEKTDADNWNCYNYTRLSFNRWSTLIAGLSYQNYDRGASESDQFSPKTGLLLSPWEGQTIRLALFRRLSTNLVADQTIEPTQVAGFNQLFDDIPGTDFWTAGIAVDQRLDRHLFAGIEFYQRWLEVPFTTIDLNTGGSTLHQADWQEHIGRIYTYWAPHPWLAAKLEYSYERFDDREDFEGIEGFAELLTHRIKIGAGFFHPSGFSARLATTWVDQQGDFFASGGDPESLFQDGDRFWVIDAALSYRLPARTGILSFEVRNLLDDSFRFQDTDPRHPSITAERAALLRLTLSF